MSFSFSTFRIVLGIALMAWSGPVVGRLHAQGSQPACGIELSEPSGNELTTNPNQIAAKKAGRKQLEKDLSKPPISAPNSSLRGIAPQPARPAAFAVPNLRAQELMERRRNWVLMSPEDLVAAPDVEEMLNTPEYGEDGQEKKKLSPLERYYQNLDRGRNATTTKSKVQDDDAFGLRNPNASRDEAGPQDDTNPSGDGSVNKRTAKRLFNPDSDLSGLVPSRSSFSDIFGLGNAKPLVDHDERQKARKKELEQLYGLTPSLPATGPDPGNQLGRLNDPAPRPAQPGAGLYGISSSSAQGGFGQQNAIGPSSLPPALPKAEPPSLMPPKPSFKAPQRPF
jgi:hypothetical protein